MKRLFALLLALVMLVSVLVACNKPVEEKPDDTKAPTQGKTDDPKPSEKEEETPQWKIDHPGWLCEEKQTLTCFAMEDVPPRLNISNDNFFWQWMEEFTNVHIEWELGPSVSADYNAVINAKLSSGEELPDILYIGDVYIGMDAGYNGLLIDMLPYLQDGTAPYLAQLGEKENRDYINDLLSEDGKFYGFRWVNPAYENLQILMFRLDWLEKVGKEMPTTLDELNDVFRALRDYGDLNGNGEDDEIILTACGAGELFNVFGPIFDIETMASRNELVRVDENGKVYPGYTTEGMKAFFNWIQMLLDEDILDPEAITAKTTETEEKVAADRVAAICYYQSYMATYGNMTPAGQAEPNKPIYYLCPMVGSEYNGGQAKLTAQIRYGARFTGVTKDCENPALATAWLDTLYAHDEVEFTRCCGMEGRDWKRGEDGQPVYIAPAEGEWLGASKYTGGSQFNLCHRQSYFMLNFAKSDPSSPTHWCFEAYNVYRNDTDRWFKNPEVPCAANQTEAEKEVYDMYWTDFHSGWKEWRDLFMSGEKSVEKDWDEFVATLESLGMNELIEGVFQPQYDRLS